MKIKNFNAFVGVIIFLIIALSAFIIVRKIISPNDFGLIFLLVIGSSILLWVDFQVGLANSKKEKLFEKNAEQKAIKFFFLLIVFSLLVYDLSVVILSLLKINVSYAFSIILIYLTTCGIVIFNAIDYSEDLIDG